MIRATNRGSSSAVRPRCRCVDRAWPSTRQARRSETPSWWRTTATALEDRVPRIIALRTRGVRAAYDALRQRGIEFITDPRGPDPDTGLEAVVCCRDPDGLIVELIEYLPGVLGSRIDKLERR